MGDSVVESPEDVDDIPDDAASLFAGGVSRPNNAARRTRLLNSLGRPVLPISAGIILLASVAICSSDEPGAQRTSNPMEPLHFIAFGFAYFPCILLFITPTRHPSLDTACLTWNTWQGRTHVGFFILQLSLFLSRFCSQMRLVATTARGDASKHSRIVHGVDTGLHTMLVLVTGFSVYTRRISAWQANRAAWITSAFIAFSLNLALASGPDIQLPPCNGVCYLPPCTCGLRAGLWLNLFEFAIALCYSPEFGLWLQGIVGRVLPLSALTRPELAVHDASAETSHRAERRKDADGYSLSDHSSQRSNSRRSAASTYYGTDSEVAEAFGKRRWADLQDASSCSGTSHIGDLH